MTGVPINIQLSAYLIDNPYPRRSGASISLVNSSDRLSVSPVQNDAADVHSFVIANSIDLGYPAILSFSKDVRDLLSLAVSLISNTVIFSGNVLVPLLYNVPVIAPQNNSLLTVVASVGPMTRLLELDEGRLFNVIDELLMFKFSQPYGRSLEDHNLYEAIRAYLDAADAHVEFSRRRHFWRALEKAINSDRGDHELSGAALDAEVARLSGLPEARVRDIRELENRTKHIARQINDVHTYMDFLDQEAALTSSLKIAVDQVLLDKLVQRRNRLQAEPSSDPPRHIVRTLRTS